MGRIVEDTKLASQYSATKRIERWGWHTHAASTLNVGGTSFDLPWLEGATGFEIGVTIQSGETVRIEIFT